MARSAGDGMQKMVVDEDDFAELTLNDNGMIRDCNKAVERLFGYPPGKLLWQHVSVVLPQLAGVTLINGGEINPRLHFLAHIGHRFEMVGLGGMRCAVMIFLNIFETRGRHDVRVTLCPAPEEYRQ